MKVMTKMGFNSVWVNWIYECLSTAKFSVLINGSPSSNYTMGRGVRQGDPLFPFLFLIAVEGLKCLLPKATDMGLIDAVRLSNLDPGLNLPQFADDTLVFVPADLEKL